MKKLKVLNLYAGIGGNRKLWEDVEVTAVEWDQETAKVYQDYFPNDKMVIGDAHQYLLDHYKEFDFIWSSPPCPSHSRVRMMASKHGDYKPIFPDMTLWQQIIFLNGFCEGKYCVENVAPYYEPLIQPSKKLHRHYYWTNFRIADFQDYTKGRIHNNIQDSDELYGFNVQGTGIENKRKALRNMVDPELGLHILNAARNIITKSKTSQATLF